MRPASLLPDSDAWDSEWCWFWYNEVLAQLVFDIDELVLVKSVMRDIQRILPESRHPLLSIIHYEESYIALMYLDLCEIFDEDLSECPPDSTRILASRVRNLARGRVRNQHPVV